MVINSVTGLSTLAVFAAYYTIGSMKLAVQGVNLAITPSLRRYVDAKLIKTVERLLVRHSAYPASAIDLQLACATRHHKKGKFWEAIANLHLPGSQTRHKTSAEDIYSAIDELEDILKREIKIYKERSRSRLLRGARQAKKDLHLVRSARLYRQGRIRQEGI